MSTNLLRLAMVGSGGAAEPPPDPPDPPDPPAASDAHPRLASVRFSGFGYTQSGALAETDRKAMGLMDAVILGGFFGSPQDNGTPGPNYISRTDVTQEILDAHFDAYGTNDIYVTTYVVQMTTNEEGTFGEKCFAEEGPNGTDWWYRNSSGTIVSASGESPGSGGFINISDEITLDSSDRGYCQYYADVRVIAELMDVHATAGIGAGEGGMSPWYDNLGFHMKKSGIDPDQDGQNDDMQDYYDPDDAGHVAEQPKAVEFVGEYRANQRDGIDRVAIAHPGILKGGNSNQYSQGYSGSPTGSNAPYMMKEYRLDPDDIDSKGFQQIGLSENNNWRPTEDPAGWMRSHVLWTGVSSAAGGSWLAAYNNAYMPRVTMSDPAILPYEWIIDTLQSGSNGPAGRVVYPSAPSANTAWNMHRWAMASSMLCGAHYAPSGIVVGTSTSGERQATVLYDEMGLINGSVDYLDFGSGNTKLFRKWMGQAVDPVQASAWSGDLWKREFDNCLVIINTNWDDTDPAQTVSVAALPGGSTEWMRFVGDQDNSWNDGTDASSDFTIPSIDAIFLVRKSWYDAL